MIGASVKKCVCGADPQHVYIIKQRAGASTHPWYVACCECGRVGRHGENRPEAVSHWNRNKLLYDAAKEPRPCNMTDR